LNGVTKTEILCAEVTMTWGRLRTRGLGRCRAQETKFPVHACLRCSGGAGCAGCSSTRRLGRLGILRTREHPAHEVHVKLAKRCFLNAMHSHKICMRHAFVVYQIGRDFYKWYRFIGSTRRPEVLHDPCVYIGAVVFNNMNTVEN
jgi:hypothetical protein